MSNRKQRRTDEALQRKAKDHVTCERRFICKDTGARYRVLVNLCFNGDMGISILKNGLLLQGDDDDGQD